MAGVSVNLAGEGSLRQARQVQAENVADKCEDACGEPDTVQRHQGYQY